MRRILHLNNIFNYNNYMKNCICNIRTTSQVENDRSKRQREPSSSDNNEDKTPKKKEPNKKLCKSFQELFTKCFQMKQQFCFSKKTEKRTFYIVTICSKYC